MRFTFVFFPLFALWPVIAILGGQGFSVFVLIAGVLSLFWWRADRQGFRVSACALFMFLGWALYTNQWSSYSSPLISGSFVEENIAIKSGALRISLLAFFGVFYWSAMAYLRKFPRIWWVAFIGLILALHGIINTAIGLAFASYFTLITDPEMLHRANETLQNITRSLNIFALALPILLGWAFVQRALSLNLAIGLLAFSTLIVSHVLGATAAGLACLAGLLGVSLARSAPRLSLCMGLAILASLSAAMPLIISTAYQTYPDIAQMLSPSAQARLHGWVYTVEMIWQAPYFGHGLDAAKSWTDTYATKPELAANLPANWANYSIVSGHPHNMALQIWAETGLVGMGLWVLFLVSLTISLLRHIAQDSFLAPVIAGIIWALLPIFFTAYNLWNEAFWSSLLVIILVTGLMHAGLRISQYNALPYDPN